MRKTIRKLKGQIRGKGHSSYTTDRQAKILRDTDLRVLGPLCRYDSNLSGSKIWDLVRISQVRTGEGDGNRRWEGEIGEYTSIKMGVSAMTRTPGILLYFATYSFGESMVLLQQLLHHTFLDHLIVLHVILLRRSPVVTMRSSTDIICMALDQHSFMHSSLTSTGFTCANWFELSVSYRNAPLPQQRLLRLISSFLSFRRSSRSCITNV